MEELEVGGGARRSYTHQIIAGLLEQGNKSDISARLFHVETVRHRLEQQHSHFVPNWFRIMQILHSLSAKSWF